ncbi:hypothetical protein YC2023_074802 [Brassica napus]
MVSCLNGFPLSPRPLPTEPRLNESCDVVRLDFARVLVMRRSRAHGGRRTLRPESGARTRWIETKAQEYLLVTTQIGRNLKVLQGFSEISHKTVGEVEKDHQCWQRPEDMSTPRTAYAVETQYPASDLAGEITAAFAAASIAFKRYDPSYAQRLLKNALKTFKYADSHRGSYTNNTWVKLAVCPFYCSINGYGDELLWGAAWLRRATGKASYSKYLVDNRHSLGADFNYYEFGWDNKVGGVNVLVAKEAFEKNVPEIAPYRDTAEQMMCAYFPETAGPHMTYTPGGLLYKPGSNILQNTVALSFLLLTYAGYLSKSSQQLHCGSVKIHPESLRHLAKRQVVDYILGDNPMKMSYMIGYGNHYPRKIHHRGASSPSIATHPKTIKCLEGWNIFASPKPDPNILVGAVVGGPNVDDKFVGGRNNASETEPTTYINAPFGLNAHVLITDIIQ